MYLKITGGRTLNIQGLECNIPPVGYVVNITTNQLEYRGVYMRSNIKEEQYWERLPLPKWYKEISKKQDDYNKKKKEDEPEFYDEQLDEYIKQEWDRRLNGFWFKNKGEDVYLAGAHYMYIQWWQIDIGYPKFRYPDLEYFYFLQCCIEDPECFGMIEVCKRRWGKCFSKNTPIRMYDGSVKNVQDVKDGDEVMGDDSTKRIAYGITSGSEMMYRISPNKGMGFDCNKSHILSLIWNGTTTNTMYGWEKNSVINISVEDYIQLKDWEKEHLVLYRNGWGNNYKEQQHYIPSYILGIYLGDGCKTYGNITTTDDEIVNEITSFANSIGLVCNRTIGYKRDISYRICQESTCVNENGIKHLKKWAVNPYRQELRNINVLNNKHIPTSYLIDSEENRLQLLAGIIDTDGHLMLVKDRPHGYEITQKNERLANDIVELARSLGFYVNIRKKLATMIRADGSIHRCEVNRISIYGELHRIPCKVSRKKCDVLSRRANCLRTGFSIKEIGYGEYYGFAVDGNNLFLLADGTVVHNTFRAGLFLYEYTTRTRNANAGIQSKTGLDSSKFFAKAVVAPFKRLPKFFRPEYDTSLGITPKTVIRFQQTNVRGKAAESLLDKDELGSMIDHQSADVVAYDGQKIHRYVGDEAAKTIECNVYDRHNVIKYCLLDDEGRIIGKALYCTTIEKMETEKDGVQEAFRKLWDESDQLNKQENRRTISGLYRFFMTADRGRNIDIYGEANVEKTVTELLLERKAVEGNPRSLSQLIRKEPRTIKEAFLTDGDKCLFDSISINEQIDSLSYNSMTERGNLVWEDGHEYYKEITLPNGEKDIKISKLLWVANYNGEYEKVKGWMPKEMNNISIRNGNFRPNGNYSMRIGCDPFKYDKTKSSKKSDGVAYGFQMEDELDKENEFNNMFTICWAGRPSTTSIQYDRILKMAWWCGCQVLFERNVYEWKLYFNNKKCGGFLMWLPNEVEPGIFTGGNAENGTVQVIADQINTYIDSSIKKVYFKNLMEEKSGWLGLRVEETQEFDHAMASGITLIAAKQKKYSIDNKNVLDINNVMPIREAI